MSGLSGACEPGDPGPGAGLLPWGDGARALVVPPGSDAKTLSDAVGRIPGALRFAEAFGDVEVVLVYRPDEVEVSRRGAVGAVLRAALGVGEAAADGRRWATEGERQAYLAGKADFADELRCEVTGATGAVPQDPTTSGTSPRAEPIPGDAVAATVNGVAGAYRHGGHHIVFRHSFAPHMSATDLKIVKGLAGRVLRARGRYLRR